MKNDARKSSLSIDPSASLNTPPKKQLTRDLSLNWPTRGTFVKGANSCRKPILVVLLNFEEAYAVNIDEEAVLRVYSEAPTYIMLDQSGYR